MYHKGALVMSKTNPASNANPYLNLTMDTSFKAFFKDESMSTPLLQNFLPLPENRKIVSLKVLDPVMTPENIENKSPILDLRIRLDSKEYVNIEVQIMHMKDFKERILYYLSRLYTEQLKRGTKYFTLCPSYSLVFTKFTVFKELKNYYSVFELKERTQPEVVFSNHLGIVLVELDKFKGKSIRDLIDKKDKWTYLIKNSNDISSEELKVLSRKGDGMKEATKRLAVLSEDENLRMLEEAREKNWRDEQARRDYAIEEGLKEGRAKGIKEGRLEVALNLLKENVSLDIIEKTTGLSKTEIKKLKG